MKVMIKRLHSPDLPLPHYQTPGSAGVDLYAANEQDIIIPVGGRAQIPTGIAVAMPTDYEAQIRPRSGLALKYGLTLLNTPGTIDSDYRGEIKLIVINLGDKEYTLKRGERIAQMVFSRIMQVDLQETDELEDTIRGSGGFGHTGK
ncbi:Deoxyuridine triphosphate nucleotidohydrolase [Syntrophomonas zehnderi OL-4]|uniref:Deoxyuridine 5'-triphosphate nucleotidohydrolase n=1 Tax=Syntrophomonas zehnderi OL-4 TaxID=690567 RepID=A0A0E4GBZ3_9FIRM|nr:dUTP diphosphatase [Syntrophomonas zehnderi]CFX68166.1 Deoxyuridine triphosphate nucleotidohydrolase [Syntrophomonas zehnderi OL-4]